MEDRKADFLSYLSWEALRRRLSVPAGHPLLGLRAELQEAPAPLLEHNPSLVGVALLLQEEARSQCPPPRGVSCPEAGTAGNLGHRGQGGFFGLQLPDVIKGLRVVPDHALQLL